MIRKTWMDDYVPRWRRQTVKDAAALVSTATGLPRKLVYARALQIHEES